MLGGNFNRVEAINDLKRAPRVLFIGIWLVCI